MYLMTYKFNPRYIFIQNVVIFSSKNLDKIVQGNVIHYNLNLEMIQISISTIAWVVNYSIFTQQNTVLQQFSTRDDFAPHPHHPPGIFGDTSGNILGCHKWGVLLASSGLEVKDAGKHPSMHRRAPITKNYAIQNVNRTEFEKFQPTAYENE